MKIALLGDISLNGRFDLSKNLDSLERVKQIKDTVKYCDFVVANLESPLTDVIKTKVCKGAYLKSGTKSNEILKYLGITHVTLANNHLFDYGLKGMRETVKAIKSIGVKYVGLNNSPEILSKGNDKAILDGFCCYSSNAVRYGKGKDKIQALCYENVLEFFEKAKNEGALPIVSAHFGIEHVHYPSKEHVLMFREFANKYNYVLHGHHPHALQGDELVGKSNLFYSLGNACFDDIDTTSIRETVFQTEESSKSYIVLLTIDGVEVVNVERVGFKFDQERYVHCDERILNEIRAYSASLSEDIENLAKLRKQNLSKAEKSSKNLKFVFARLNYKYIGAYIKGRAHSKKYNKIFNRKKGR